MIAQINKVLQEKFGYSSFRTGQKEAIASVLKKQDTLVMLPTGTGKSLCYQLPTYLSEGTTLVVSPLLSLMQDQVENLRLRGENRVVALNSLTSYPERRRIFKQINQYKFIYTSPEMLQNDQVIEILKRVNIQLFVVDEAHCISHWGTDFRPDYLALANVRKKLGFPTTMALTATATKQVREEIIQFLGLDFEQTHQIIKSVDREEIKFLVEICEGNKSEILTQYVTQLTGPGIIYFTSKKMADDWANKLIIELGIKASSYHSDLEADDKIKIQQQFLHNELQIICATSAFGMGFDKEDIRFVIHYHIPGSPEMYLQEVGRASRDGKESIAVLLYQPGDENIQRRFIEKSLPSKEELKIAYKQNSKNSINDDSVVKLAEFFAKTSTNINEASEKIKSRKEIKNKQLYFMLQYVYENTCKRNYLLNYFDESPKGDINKCCASCGIDREKIISEVNRLHDTNPKEKLENIVFPWQKVFKSLYKNLQE